MSNLYRVAKSRNGRQWDVIDSDGDILEGGFFTRAAAVACCDAANDNEARGLEDAPGYQDFPPQYR